MHNSSFDITTFATYVYETKLRPAFNRAAKLFNSTNVYLKKNPKLRLGIAGTILFIIFWIIGWKTLDPDFGWHLRSGFYIRAHWIPAHDIYTYTARSFHWIDHEWGNDVILSFVYGLGGYWLADTMYALMWTTALLVAGGRKARITTLIIAAIAVCPYVGLRPVTWSVLFFTLTLLVLRRKRSGIDWLLIPFFAVWANLHGGFVIGLATIAYFAIFKRSKKLAIIFLLAALATAINAYGINLYVEIGRTLFDPALHKEVAEWAPFDITQPTRLFVVLWGAGFLLFAASNWKKWLGLSPILLAAGLSATRHLPFFVVASIREVDDFIDQAKASIPKNLDLPRKLVLGFLVLGLFWLFLYCAYSAFYPFSLNRESGYPTQAVAYLEAHPCPGNVFNSYNFGGYLIWKMPNQPVYIDGRMPSWQPYMRNYENLLNNPSKEYPLQFSQYNVKCALLDRHVQTSKLYDLLKKDHWKEVVSTDNYKLLLAPQKTPYILP